MSNNDIIFFVVDNDSNNRGTFGRLIEKLFPSMKYELIDDSYKAINRLKNETRKIILLANFELQVINGLQLLSKVREEIKTKESYVILINQGADTELNIKAIKLGADDVIFKPFSFDQLITKLRSAVRYTTMMSKIEVANKLIEDLKEELNNEVLKMKDNLVDLYLSKDPGAENKILRITSASVWIANKIGSLNESEIRIIENAASLSFIGKLKLPEAMLNIPIMKNGIVTNTTIEKVPVYARSIIERLKGFEDVAYNVYHVFENFDGSGIPEKILAWQIPIGSRIIRVAWDYEEQIEQFRGIESKAMELIYHESKRLYDFKIVSLFDQYLATLPVNQTREKAVDIKELVESMVLSRNIVTESGLKLMSAGLMLNVDAIEKIREIKKSDPIIGDIYVRRKK
jgi:response regulator RpfG family c-di-GMP phosphodiesterase